MRPETLVTLAPLRTIRVWTDPVPAGDAARLRISKGARVPARVVLLADDGQVFHAVRATIVLLDRNDDERGQVEVELAIECAAQVAKAPDHRDDPARRLFRDVQPRPSRPAAFNGHPVAAPATAPSESAAIWQGLRGRRLRLGISQAVLADMVGCSPGNLCEGELGKVSRVGLANRVRDLLDQLERERGNGHAVGAH